MLDVSATVTKTDFVASVGISFSTFAFISFVFFFALLYDIMVSFNKLQFSSPPSVPQG